VSAAERPRTVVKIGSSSVTGDDGRPDRGLLGRLAAEIAAELEAGCDVVVVSSGAIAAGWAAIGAGADRPRDLAVLQAVSAVGQHSLMSAWADAFSAAGRDVGQVLLAPLDFADRNQYLHARQTLDQLLRLSVVPIVNENDAVADDEIRFGDNDRLAALVAHLVGAARLVLLTDAEGLLSADPRLDAEASLIEEVTETDRWLESVAGGPGEVGSGGMASKLAAARIASWSGIEAVIASAARPGLLREIAEGAPGTGTRFRPRESRLSARKLWIAFALAPSGRLVIDAGAVAALRGEGPSLLAQGVVGVEGDFGVDDAVEIVDEAGGLVAKGLTRRSADRAARVEHAEAPGSNVVVHRDDLVVLMAPIVDQA
jgi:glutamate 5-kinase